ncbi:MAG: hypothetical protein CVV18_02935 [Gammaproteobacteria bacterium HGW-Gammaproteobacteria-8]|nr:MAG: hypothetical protein CVV18_02935 [Gammaproteobacteria bacterium HGW-Gammaproteobacteria-8]
MLFLAVFCSPLLATQPQPALHAPLAEKSLLLDVTAYNGSGFVAVGERGHILVSANGREWRQSESVPARSTLTRVTHFGRRLWAVGHDAVILSSMDGGENWHVQHFDPEGDDLDPSAQGPLLDIMFVNPNKGFAIGAYGRYMTTEDGGIHWAVERLSDRVTSEAIDWAALAREQDGYDTMPDDFDTGLDDDALAELDRGCYDLDECHLNAIIDLGDNRLMIAAERGYGFRSRDRGDTWEAFRFPYPGSMFGLVQQGDCILAFGLRGHIQRSCDFGDRWEDLEVEGQQTLLGGDVDRDGRAVLVGSGASRVTIAPDGTIRRTADRLGSDYAAVVIDGDGLILVGENGVRHE